MKIWHTSFKVILCMLAISGCNVGQEQIAQHHSANEHSANKNAATSTIVEQKIAAALSQQDFRLYQSAGRRVVVPGFEKENIKPIKLICGLKVIPGSSDVLKSAQDKKAQRMRYQFAKQFNLVMFEHCQQLKTKSQRVD